jgi:hypothetical protein
MESQLDSFIPEQRTGKQNDLKSSAEHSDDLSAREHYLRCRNRMLNVNSWNEAGGRLGADFQLMDGNGDALERSALPGDFIRIDVPGPGSAAGKGYDWVVIEKLEEQSEGIENDFVVITVRPTENPRTEENDTAHFFDANASSTFIIQRNGKVVTAEYHGRNETPNVQTDNKIDKVRNAAVALGGMLGLSEVQWKSLINGLLKD